MDLSYFSILTFDLLLTLLTILPSHLNGHIWSWGLSLPLTQSDNTQLGNSNEPELHPNFDIQNATDSRTEAEQGFCQNNKQCGRGRYCDTHFGKCERLKRRGDLCRKDYHCQRKHECVFGRCRREISKGLEGSRCEEGKDCPADNCCARQHGERICKARLKISMKCFIPAGGLDYSLNEQCPCENGLVCQYEPVKPTTPSTIRNQHKEWFQISSDVAQMKCLPWT